MHNLQVAVERTADAAQDLATGLADAVGARGWHVATAESLTAGNIANVLAAAPSASTWLRGSLVAYSPEVKFRLGVPRGPVVTEECALILARRAVELLDADLCVAVTGVGGPEPDEGHAPGTVWFAVVSPAGEHTVKEVFDGDPPQVLVATTERAIALLTDVARGA
ncbi:CinA family protein [Xylanimonas oleitrophica]|uniref:CinA family protein n=1 Tax=Xylanimonas oleitrophica TaxID=2607479 RepID=A0A2W5WKT3_9MICO|nr:CinA family protein [Xylanimonas oleitrophica]PZR52159.1 CinA family protein [Xylanimonas oleitrophica]